MSDIQLSIGPDRFPARFETAAAPQTVAAFAAHLPFASKAIHVRWSGEAIWMPLGTLNFGVGYENATSHPAPGQIILYPGGVSETEILLGYGAVAFASKAGPLAGNHFLTITDSLDRLASVCRDILWSGARDIVFTRN